MLERMIPICKMFAHMQGVLQTSVVSEVDLVYQHCLKVISCYFLNL